MVLIQANGPNHASNACSYNDCEKEIGVLNIKDQKLHF